MHKCLVADIRLAGILDTHLCFISPFMFCLIGRCSRRWSPGAGVPRRRILLRRDPRRPGPGVVSEAPRQEALPFRSVSLMLFVLAFLRQNLSNSVCTQILWLFLFFYFGPPGPPLFYLFFYFFFFCFLRCFFFSWPLISCV